MPERADNAMAGAAGARRIAQAAVLGLLAVTMIVGLTEMREVSPNAIALAALPAQIGDWTAVDDEFELAEDESYVMLERTYRRADGHEALLRVQATYTRLGSLRDWSLAATAIGWTPKSEYVWSAEEGAMEVRMQRLQKRSHERIAASWYTSARSQTPSLKRAQLLAWRDRLYGDRRAWASIYLLLPAPPESDAEEASKQILAAVGPELRELVTSSRPAG